MLELPGLDAPTVRRLLPRNRLAFVEEVRQHLGGRRWENSMLDELEDGDRERMLRLSELAERAPQVVQLWEATGEPPPFKGNGWAKSRLETAYGSDVEAGWSQYIAAIEKALNSPGAAADISTGAAAVPSEPRQAELTVDPRPPEAVPSLPEPNPDEGIGLRGLISRFRR